MLAKVDTKSARKVRHSQVKSELTNRANTKERTSFSLTKDMTDVEINNAMLSKLFSVRKELGLA